MKKIASAILGFFLLVLFIWIMYFLSSQNYNVVGGWMFMVVLNFLFIVNMGLIAYLVFLVLQDKAISNRLLETVKQIGGLAAAWGAWSTILGLFFAFSAIEESKEVIPLQVISGGLKVGIITVLYGLIIFCHALVGYIGLNLSRQTAA